MLVQRGAIDQLLWSKVWRCFRRRSSTGRASRRSRRHDCMYPPSGTIVRMPAGTSGARPPRMARPSGVREIGRRLLQPELVLPQQYAASYRPLTGSQRLMAAVLEGAIALLCRPPKAQVGYGGRQEAVMRDSARWFRADDRRSAFSFLRICEALDLDPFRVRRLVLRGMPEDGSGRLAARIRRTRL